MNYDREQSVKDVIDLLDFIESCVSGWYYSEDQASEEDFEAAINFLNKQREEYE